MININDFFHHIEHFNHGKKEIDLVHNCLLFGAVLASKPENVLELGIGNGYATRAIFYALKYNKKGKLTSIDNWHDWKGKEPSHVDALRYLGVNVVAPIHERDFVRKQPDNTYDFLLSDCDHRHAGEWAEDVFRIVKPSGLMFFHDISQCESLKRYVEISKERRLSHFIFSKNSRKEERCERGFLMVIND